MGSATSRDEHNELLIRTGMELSADLALPTVLQRIVELASEITDAKYGALGVLTKGRVTDFYTTGLTESQRQRMGKLPEGHGILGVIVHDPKPLRLSDLSQDPRSSGFPANHPPMHSFLGTPIKLGGTVFGNIYLTEKEGAKEFSEEDERALEILASQAGLAIRNASMYEELARREARLSDLDAARSTLLHAVSHDLRSPITGILGSVITLERADQMGLSEEDRQALLGGVMSAARKMSRLVEGLLDMHRLDAGVVEPDCSTNDVGALVRMVVNEMDFGERTLFIDTESALASIDPTQVERIVENLLMNAIRHTPDGTPIKVSVTQSQDGVLITVDDSGPGVPDAAREVIFEPFRRGAASIRVAGTGIGLSLVRQFAELQGGRAWVQDRPAGGASFRVLLPNADGYDRSTAPESIETAL